MLVKVRKGDTTGWGMVETFQVYRYGNHGTVTITGLVGADGKLTESYVFRGGEFIPASQIDEEMGIEKYIKAKKPFYMKLSEGFPVRVKASIDYTTGECVIDKSSCEVFQVSGREMSLNYGSVKLTRLLNIPDKMNVLMENVIKEVANCKGNRVAYIKSRFR